MRCPLLLLTTHDVAPRQRSMRRVYEASWVRLSPAEQSALAGLSVMRGSFSAEAARAVAHTTPLVLRQLRHKSLLQSTEIGRLALHELVRQLAREKVENSAELSNTHAHYFLNLIAAKSPLLIGEDAAQTARALQQNIDNLRAAWQTAISTFDYALIQIALQPLSDFLTHIGSLQEVERLVEQAIAVFADAIPGAASAALALHLRFIQL